MTGDREKNRLGYSKANGMMETFESAEESVKEFLVMATASMNRMTRAKELAESNGREAR